MDFTISDEERAVLASVRAFIDHEVVPYEAELMERDSRGEVGLLTPGERRELQAKARRSGLWGIDTPEQYGGAALSSLLVAMIYTEYGRSFVDFKFGGWSPEILYLVDEDQKREYLIPQIEGTRHYCYALTEPGTGSDARNLSTTAVRMGDEWVLNGEKVFITYGNEADFAIVFARTPEEPVPAGSVTAFLVDRDMGWKSSRLRMMGAHDAASLYFDSVRVPLRNVFGEVGGGFGLALQFIHRNRYQLPARWAGAGERLLEMAIAHATTRETFGRPLASRENIAFMVADAETDVRATKLLAYHAAGLQDQGSDYRHAANAAKLFGAQAANRVVDAVMQIHGGMGYSKEMPIERWYRDLRVARIYEGSDEMARMAIARDLFRGHVAPGQLT